MRSTMPLIYRHRKRPSSEVVIDANAITSITWRKDRWVEVQVGNKTYDFSYPNKDLAEAAYISIRQFAGLSKPISIN